MSDIKRKLPSINNSIFYQKLKESQQRPDKVCFAYIFPHNCWIEFEHIIELHPNYVTFSYTGTMDDTPYLFEETIRMDGIKSIKVGIRLPETVEDTVEQLDKMYQAHIKEYEAGENAITNQED